MKEVEPSFIHSAPIRVLLDGRKISDGGIGSYIRNLVYALSERLDVELTVLVKQGEPISDRVQAKVHWVQDQAKPYSLDELLFMPGRLHFSQFDLFHAPHFTLPYRIPVPTVVTLHDLIHITHPEHWYYPLVARPLIRSAIKRASAVICVSDSTKQAANRLVEKVEQKIFHIPNSVIIKPGQAKDIPPTPSNGDYFLAVLSNLKPHKGLRDLVQAFWQYRQNRSDGCLELVLAGYGAESLKVSSDSFNLEGIKIAGKVSEEQLSELYQGATALVVPSLAEGFCLPAIEAMAFGVPIVSRPIPALLEYLPEGATVANDFSVEALADALGQMHDQIEVKRSEAQNALATLARFSPEVVSDQTLAVYRTVLKSSGIQRR